MAPVPALQAEEDRKSNHVALREAFISPVTRQLMRRSISPLTRQLMRDSDMPSNGQKDFMDPVPKSNTAALICPITHQLMRESVMLNGHVASPSKTVLFARSHPKTFLIICSLMSILLGILCRGVYDITNPSYTVSSRSQPPSRPGPRYCSVTGSYSSSPPPPSCTLPFSSATGSSNHNSMPSSPSQSGRTPGPIIPPSQSITETAIHPASPSPKVKRNHIQVVLVWLPGFCKIIRPCWRNLDRKMFHLHGLWVAVEQGLNQVLCKVPENEEDPLELLDIETTDDLLQLWPSYECKNIKNLNETCQDYQTIKLWQHEFTKHGSCAEEIRKDYFRRVVSIIRRIRKAKIETLLAADGIVPNLKTVYTSEQFANAIEMLTGGKKKIGFRCTKKEGYLREVTLCMDLQASEFISCPDYPSNEHCSVKGSAIFPPPETI